MNLEAYAHFLEAWGYRVVRTESCIWYEAGRRFFQAFPTHHPLTPSAAEIRQVLWQGKAAGLRYASAPQADTGNSYVLVCDNPAYELNALEHKARNQTRRGLERCTVGPVSFGALAVEGQAINRSTWRRQERKVSGVRADWDRFCRAAEATPGFEAWGAFVEGRLAAFWVVFLMQECCHVIWHMSHEDYLSAYPNNALIFQCTQEVLSRPGIALVSYGLRSLDALATLDRFKLAMGYRQQPIDQQIVLHPFVRPLAHPVLTALATRLSARYPKSDFWRKTQGVLRVVQKDDTLSNNC